MKPAHGSHSFFENDLLDPERTIELTSPTVTPVVQDRTKTEHGVSQHAGLSFRRPWVKLDSWGIPYALDIFGDRSVYIVDAPGHLQGHINLLVNVGKGANTDNESDRTGSRWMYLAGDACHDRRLLRKQRDIGEWLDERGHRCCIHADPKIASETMARIYGLEQMGVEVILAHDVEWEERVHGDKTKLWG